MLSKVKVSGARIAILASLVLFSTVLARADVYKITFINVTFSATCIGGGGTCTEVVNGSGLFDGVTGKASDLSYNLTGSLNASLDSWGKPACSVPGCFGSISLYDSNALPGYNPIEFSPTLPTVDAPTPQPVEGGPKGTQLFVPVPCGGDQPNCNQPGAFPGNRTMDYEVTSGQYTSVDVGPSATPEPASLLLVLGGLGMVAVLRRRVKAALDSQG